MSYSSELFIFIKNAILTINTKNISVINIITSSLSSKWLFFVARSYDLRVHDSLQDVEGRVLLEKCMCKGLRLHSVEFIWKRRSTCKTIWLIDVNIFTGTHSNSEFDYETQQELT